jgi:hypothetical protein
MTNTYDTITFFKIPVSVEDLNETYYLFDILLPTEFDENLLLMVLSFLSKIRSIFYNQKNIDQLLSTFLDSQSFIYFNFLYMNQIDDNRISNEGLKYIKLGLKKISLNNQEKSDFYFNSVICMELMKFYSN